MTLTDNCCCFEGNKASFYTRSKLVEGIDVIQELSSSPKEPVNSAATSSAGMPKASKTSVGKQTVPQGLLSYVGMDQLVNKPGLDPPALGERSANAVKKIATSTTLYRTS